MATLEGRIQALKDEIRGSDGENVAGRDFRVEVEALIDAFYEDLGEIRTIDLNHLFDLFVIKTLYVDRASRHYEVLDYLGRMLTRYLYSSELGAGPASGYYLSDVLRELEQPGGHFQNAFEAYRRYGDNALFVTGVCGRSLRPRRRKRAGMLGAVGPAIDESYYISTGRAFYRLAAETELAEETEQRRLLEKLAEFFPVYRDALSEASDKYILGFDMARIADLMLDQFNQYRRTQDERNLESARKYAAILKLDEASFPALYESRPRAVILRPPGETEPPA
ncbi:MAG: hypothetical protein WEB00_01975 [Dehalococcoidia bacterium]